MPAKSFLLTYWRTDHPLVVLPRLTHNPEDWIYHGTAKLNGVTGTLAFRCAWLAKIFGRLAEIQNRHGCHRAQENPVHASRPNPKVWVGKVDNDSDDAV